MLILLFMRTVGGFALAMVLGFVGIVAANVVIQSGGGGWPDWLVRLVWYTGGGLAAGVGSFVAWIPTESSRPRILLTLLLVLLGALGGAWGGWYYKVYINEDLAAFSIKAVSSTALFGAALAANLVAASMGIVRQVRSGSY